MGISREQALDCFRSDDLIGIGMEADAVRRRLHPEGVVSYAIEAAISCAGGDVEAICAKIADAEELGATGVILEDDCAAGGFDALERLVCSLRRRFPEMWLQGLGGSAVLALGTDAEMTIGRLRDAGLDAIGGNKPEIAGDAWMDVQRAAHAVGMTATAKILFGGGESIERRLDVLEGIRDLQTETGVFVALAPISFHAIGGRELDETTAVEYLKMLAVTRMFVENVENLQSDWTTQGRKVLQMGLRFGANDVGSVGVGATEEELRRVIRDAGFKPVQRDLGYRVMMLG